jgi:hypothetical protein
MATSSTTRSGAERSTAASASPPSPAVSILYPSAASVRSSIRLIGGSSSTTRIAASAMPPRYAVTSARSAFSASKSNPFGA